MRNATYIFFFLLSLFFFGACTTSRWVVTKQHAIDRSDYEILEQRNFLTISDSLSPKKPTLKLSLKSHSTYKYAQKTLVQRNIQKYKLRPGFVLLGLSGAAAAFYAANSSQFNSESSQAVTLNAVGALLAATGFLHLKPKGNPRPVDEKRYLEKTGSISITDTVDIQQAVPSPADILVTYRGNTVFQDKPDTVYNGELDIPLGPNLNDLKLTGNQPGAFDLRVVFNDSTYRYRYPISSVLQPYARITSNITSLRSRPVRNSENVLADLATGSEIKIDRVLSKKWYKVRYGNFENYISTEDAEIIWRTANFSEQTKVVAVPRVPFGNIDVESNIPILRKYQSNTQALIMTNENYSLGWPTRRYTHRDGRLMEAYLTKALGYPNKNIHRLTDITSIKSIDDKIEQLSATGNDSTEFFVYIGGYGSISSEKELQWNLISTNGEEVAKPVLLTSLFKSIRSIPSGKTLVVADIDFSHTASGNLSQKQTNMLLRSDVTELSNGATLIMGSSIGQPSRLYRSALGEDKKHHIFPYFFAEALRQGRVNISKIYKQINQNIPYTSRKLYDRPQEPIIFGNRSFSFISQ